MSLENFDEIVSQNLSNSHAIVTNVVVATITHQQVINSNTISDNWKKIPKEICYTIQETYLKLIDDPQSSEKFRKSYRLTQYEFIWLVDQFPSIKRLKWDIKFQTLIFLDWIASKIHLQQLVRAYGMPESTVDNSIKRILENVLNLRDKIIFLPSENAELFEICAGFSERSGETNFFKNIVGAIDGSLIKLCVPEDQIEAYIDRHLDCSMNLTAICDHKMIIRFLIVGKTGACHDMNVLKSSQLYQKKLFPPKGYIILGDSAYPNTFEPIPIITPYKKTRSNDLLPNHQTKFNKTHSCARSTIERAYGDIKTKWRRIHKNIIESNVKSAPDIITAACILNNITLGQFHLANKTFLPAPPVNINIPFADANVYRDSIANQYINQ